MYNRYLWVSDRIVIVNIFLLVEDIIGKWSVQERWLSDLNVSSLWDGDNSTRLDLADVTTILTLQQEATLISGFYVKVVLSDKLEKYRRSIVRVLTSSPDSSSCPEPKQFRKCIFLEDHVYSCFCSQQCQLLVKLTFVSEWAKVYRPHEICEISMGK